MGYPWGTTGVRNIVSERYRGDDSARGHPVALGEPAHGDRRGWNHSVREPVYRAVLGFDPEEPVGEAVTNYFHPEDREEVLGTFEAVVSGQGGGIVTDIVEAHGWDVTVAEGSDGGTRIEVSGVEFK